LAQTAAVRGGTQLGAAGAVCLPAPGDSSASRAPSRLSFLWI